MKAAVFYGKKDIRIEEVKLRSFNNGEVLVKVHACGVCGTDVHIYEGAEGSATVSPPVILGHEFSGEICEVASGVQDLKIGDRVCIDPNIFCGKCHYCRNGKIHLCQRLQAIGVTRHGGFAEYCIVPETQVYKLPDNVSFEQGVMTEPIACCLHGIDLCNIQSGDTVLIIGAGTIGLIMLQLVKTGGPAQIFVSEPVETKRNLALSLGADIVCNPQTENFNSFISENTRDGVDIAIECVGLKQTVKNAIVSAARGGTVMLFGLTHPDCEAPLKPLDVFKRELTIKSSFINPFTQARAVQMLGAGRISVKELISETVPIEKIEQVLSDKNRQGSGKVIIAP